MKKTVLSLGLFLGLSHLAGAQNSVSVRIEKDFCFEGITLVYADRSREDMSLGCEGDYKFDTGSNKPEALMVNGKLCREGTTLVKTGSGTVAVAVKKVIQVDQQKLDSVLSLIR